MWNRPSLLCTLNTASKFNTSTRTFNFDRFLPKIDEEINCAVHEVQKIRKESAPFFNEQENVGRVKRGASVAAAAVMA